MLLMALPACHVFFDWDDTLSIGNRKQAMTYAQADILNAHFKTLTNELSCTLSVITGNKTY